MAEEGNSTEGEELDDKEILEEELEEEFEEPVEPKSSSEKCPECPAMAPAWMATFADMATLLMAFFVLILSFVEMEDPSIFKEVSGSMSNPNLAANRIARMIRNASSLILSSGSPTALIIPFLISSKPPW